MKISRVSTWALALPADEPLADAPDNPGGTRPVVAVELVTDDGAFGVGLTFLGAALTSALRRAVQQLGELAIGEDALQIEAIVAKLRRLAGGAGPAGIFSLALAAVEIALWDLKGKALGQPLWQMVGGDGSSVPCYASGAMMRGLPADRAAAAAGRLVERGFDAMKFQLAVPGASLEEEMLRAQLIREAAGPAAVLMCDVNQGWDFDTALAMGRRLEEIGLAWLEDPIAHDDYKALGRLARALDTPIAAGEYLYGVMPFRHLVAAGGVDVAMIDPFRAGGIGPWLQVAGVARENGLRVVSHLAPEIQLHLVSAIPNGWTVEYMPWFNRLYEEVVWPRAGRLELPRKPGLGLAFDRDVLERCCTERESS